MLRAARFPIIATNLDFTDTPLQGLTQPYLILQRKGVKIGLLGLLVSPDGLIAQYNYGNMKYLDPLSSANQTAAFLKEEKGCDLVICLSHLGYNATGEGMGDLTLARETRNIDIILGGHTHTLLRFADRRLNMDGKEVVINQVGDRGIYMGRLDVVMGKSR
jgi:5'-nucleotidase